MFKVGVTGNIGSGKTTVCKVFEVLGIPVFYADDAAKKVMVEDDLLIAGVKQQFGNESYFEDGSLNRKHIAGIVFNDKEQLTKLNALVHPATFRAFDAWVARVDKAVPYVLKEAALLFESDSYKMCNRSVLVSAPLDVRLQRVIKRDGISVDEARNRDARQFTEEVKRGMADDLILNDDTGLVIPQVLKLHQLYLSLSHS
ncbi:dephospho-CoA kinase [Mucilaginibacter pallidiroseus]|uniref:Dephospho-CoA kinase n=1 Tax=Mucilaginibacter pallidiroseus TaxID=2599295 RepID=A0A563UDR9_9SPHI|nr:dephospho-CoA kinase [Mucilaginibacter pallidiroseus]TWR29466.1 dephospho-CoA kinase [Mucilaginibacter pallidiroseus]